MSLSQGFKYTLKRGAQEESSIVPPETVKRKILQPEQNPVKSSSIHPKQPTAKRCPHFPDLEIKVAMDYNQISEDQRLISLAEAISLQLKSKINELYLDHSVLRQACLFMIDSAVDRAKESQKAHYHSRKNKELGICRDRRTLAEMLKKENDIWKGYFQKNLNTIHITNKVKILDSINSR